MFKCDEKGRRPDGPDQTCAHRAGGSSARLLAEAWTFWGTWMSLAMWPWLNAPARTPLADVLSPKGRAFGSARERPLVAERVGRPDNVVYLKFR